MSEILGLEHLALRGDGPTLTLSVRAGQSLTIVGPSGAGKSRLIRTLAGIEKPEQGTVQLRGRAVLAGATPLPRRAKVQSLARRSTADSAQRATEVLTATNLWDVRHLSVGELSPGQVAALEIVEPLVSEAEVAFFDGQLDLLDPWTLARTLEQIAEQAKAGRTFVVATNRPDVVSRFEALVVLREETVRFAGLVQDLLRSGPPHVIEVSTENAPGVRALVAPFEVRVQSEPNGLRLEAPEGQELAARLLLEGYGDVKFLTVRPPTIDEALRSL